MKNEMTLAFDSISENEAFARVAVAAFVTQILRLRYQRR